MKIILGSIPQLGYNYVQLFGLATNEDYPYWSGVTGLAGRCKYDVETRTPLVGISGCRETLNYFLSIA